MKHDRHGQHVYGSVHKKDRQRWVRKVRAGGVCCWRCGGSIPPAAAWDLGHVDEEGRRQGFPARHPEHIGCNRATVTHAKGAAGRAKVRFDGLPDPTPGNMVDRWSRHWYGGFNPRCPKCRELGAGCEAADT